MAPTHRELFYMTLLLGACSIMVLSYLIEGYAWFSKMSATFSKQLDLPVLSLPLTPNSQDMTANTTGKHTQFNLFSKSYAVSDCRNIPEVSPNIKENLTWWNTGVRDFLVFSSFLDNRTALRYRPIVRVSAIYIGSSDYIDYPKYCQVWFETDDMKAVYNRAYKMNIDETGYQTQVWKPLLLNCLLDPKEDKMPYAISIVDRPCDLPRGALKVIDARIEPKKEPTFGVCIKPMYHNYDGTGRVVEFMEVTKMLGAEHFVAYNYSSNPETLGPIFKKYIKDGMLEMIQWVPPPEVLRVVTLRRNEKEYLYWARDLGQQAATNDCLYRLMRKYSHIAMIDYDEILVPRSVKTWQELFRNLPKNYSIGSYKFLNRFYHLLWKTDASNFTDPRIKKYLPTTLLAVTPEQKYWGPGRRPKQFSLAHATLGGTIHHALLLPGFKTYVLDPKDGYMHHYRAGKGLVVPSSPFYKKMMVPVEQPDMFMWKYKEEILSRIESVFNETKAPFNGAIK